MPLNEDRAGPGKWTVFGIVAVGVLMATIDSSIVNVSLAVIAAHFGEPLGGAVEWVIIAYLVVIAALLLTAGRAADIVGRKILWAAGLIVFTVSSALCGASWSLGALVGFRALQGLGSAATMAVSPAMLVAAFPSEQRGRALGMNAVVVGTGISLGPTLGGFITESLGWRWIFYVNVPLGILGVVATLKLLPRDTGRTHEKLDWLGAGLLAVGLGALTFAATFGAEVGWTSPLLLGSAALAIVCLVALAFRIRRAKQPVVDPHLFASAVFTSAAMSSLLCFVATFAVAFLIPFYLQAVRGLSVETTGLLLTPLPLSIAIISPFTGMLADKIGTRWLAAAGMLVITGGLVWLSFLDENTSRTMLVIELVVIGIGQAMFAPPNNSALMGAAPSEHQGVAAGVLATSRVVGQSLSIALAGAIFGIVSGPLAALAAGRLEGAAAHAFVTGMQAALLVCSSVALVSAFVALVRGKEGRGSR